MKKKKKGRINYFGLLPYEMYYEIVSYFKYQRDFFNFLLVKKEIYNMFYDENNLYSKAENIKFYLENIINTFKNCYPFIVKLKVSIFKEIEINNFIGRCKIKRLKWLNFRPNFRIPFLCVEISNKTIKNLVNLEKLSISNNNITDEGIMKLTKLRKLRIFCNDNITDEGIGKLINIEILVCDNCKKITDKGIGKLPKIRKLSISFNEKITDEGIGKLENLEIFSFLDCKNITNKGIRKLKTVKELYIYYDSVPIKVTFDGIKNLKNLKKLYLSSLTNEEYWKLKEINKDLEITV